MLGDVQILRCMREGKIRISPYTREDLQSVSYNVHLARGGLRTPRFEVSDRLDLGKGGPRMEPIEFPPRNEPKEFYLGPLQFVLGALIEDITLDSTVAMRLDGRSTLGRAGLLIHVTAGLAEPGWTGPLTVEIFNVAPYATRLWEGMPIGQVTFEELPTPVLNPYGSDKLKSHYVGSTGVVGSAGLKEY